jgi:dimethylaniline monooxygenase (N-oxide forming)
VDDLLDDMELPSMRSGGNWLTWPFRVISVDEIATLGEERRAKREVDGTRAGDVIPTGEGAICTTVID